MLTANEILEWDDEGIAAPAKPLLIVENLVKHFPIKSWIFGRTTGHVRAVDGLTFTVNEGETLGIVGTAGCGKSTAARLVTQLIKPDSGTIRWRGLDVGSAALPSKRYRRHVQMVFQNNDQPTYPRLTIEGVVALGLGAQGLSRKAAKARVPAILARVGLEPKDFAGRYPKELLDGQRQRVDIARALALGSKLLILDEGLSALDTAAAVPLPDLLHDLRVEFGLSYIVISREMELARSMCDRIIVMHSGRIDATVAIQVQSPAA